MSRHRDDVQKLQSQLGNLRQPVGVLEGNLGALRTANARYADEAAQARNQRDQLALSLTNAAAKQKVSTAKRTAKSTADPRKRSGPVGKSPRTKKLWFYWEEFRAGDVRFRVGPSCTWYEPMSQANNVFEPVHIVTALSTCRE
jgi:hypothetical protein